MKRLLLTFIIAGLMAAPAASAAPLSPATQFAFNVAVNEWGSTGSCDQVDAQIVPAFASPGVVAQYSESDCYVYLSREVAGKFTKACAALVNIIGVLNGYPIPAEQRLPSTCLNHYIFLLNHPRYLTWRFSSWSSP